jgi:hypothetical protein
MATQAEENENSQREFVNPPRGFEKSARGFENPPRGFWKLAMPILESWPCEFFTKPADHHGS